MYKRPIAFLTRDEINEKLICITSKVEKVEKNINALKDKLDSIKKISNDDLKAIQKEIKITKEAVNNGKSELNSYLDFLIAKEKLSKQQYKKISRWTIKQKISGAKNRKCH